MTVSKQEVLTFIAGYIAQNEKRGNCPAKAVAEALGIGALDVIAQLKQDGTLIGKRGRTGGLMPVQQSEAQVEAVTEQETEQVEQTAIEEDSVADQFAALMEQLEGSELATG